MDDLDQLSGRDLVWVGKAHDLVAFRAENGRWPTTTSSDRHEAVLGMWLGTQRRDARKGANEFTPARRDFLDQHAPGWLTPSRGQRWQDRAHALVAFHAEHGRWPSGDAVDQNETVLGKWLWTQRTHARAQAPWFTPARRDFLDQHAPGWLPTSVDREARWQEQADLLVAFLAEHGRLPTNSRRSQDESSLGSWLGRQRADARAQAPWFTAQRRTILDAVAPGWLPQQ